MKNITLFLQINFKLVPSRYNTLMRIFQLSAKSFSDMAFNPFIESKFCLFISFGNRQKSLDTKSCECNGGGAIWFKIAKLSPIINALWAWYYHDKNHRTSCFWESESEDKTFYFNLFNGNFLKIVFAVFDILGSFWKIFSCVCEM